MEGHLALRTHPSPPGRTSESENKKGIELTEIKSTIADPKDSIEYK